MRFRLTFFALLSCTLLHAQLFQLRQDHADLHNSIQQLVNNYNTGFQQLKGELISMTPQTAIYATNLKFSSALENMIVQHSGEPAVYSWSAVMMATENFRSASRKYTSICGALKQMEFVTPEGLLRLEGQYQAPEDTKKFATTVLSFQPNEMIQNLKIAVSLQYEFPEWKLQLQLYQREREDNEAPKPRPAMIKKPL